MRGWDEGSHSCVHSRRSHSRTLWGEKASPPCWKLIGPITFTGRTVSFSCSRESCWPHIITVVRSLPDQCKSGFWLFSYQSEYSVLNTGGYRIVFVLPIFFASTNLKSADCDTSFPYKQQKWKFVVKQGCLTTNLRTDYASCGSKQTCLNLSSLTKSVSSCDDRQLRFPDDWPESRWSLGRCGEYLSGAGEIHYFSWWLGKTTYSLPVYV